MAIDINTIKVGYTVVLLDNEIPATRRGFGQARGFRINRTYTVIRVNRPQMKVYLEDQAGYQWYFLPHQLLYPFSYTADEWNID